jgi:hypothetical protein
MARRSKRKSNRAKRLAKIDQDSRPKIVPFKLDAKALSRMVAGRGTMLPTLPNMQDNLVIRKLATASIGSLPLDHFGYLLCKDKKPLRQDHILELRLALIRVYFAAAHVRLYARATQGQLESAQAALTSLTNATDQLDQVSPPRQRGLQAVFGSPMDDPKGLDELNEFGSRCLQVRMDIVPVMRVLSRAIENERTKSKPGKAGERKKRLRTLVEALANWWRPLSGKSLAPYVHAKRLDHRRAFVVGRRGQFVELAQAVFAEIDEFKKSEVISAVTNVHESQLGWTVVIAPASHSEQPWWQRLAIGQRSELHGQALWNASNVSCLKSSCIRFGAASTYWTTTRANCDGVETCGGQNCSRAGRSGPTATSPCTTPEQKLCIPYNCGCVFARPSANAYSREIIHREIGLRPCLPIRRIPPP